MFMYHKMMYLIALINYQYTFTRIHINDKFIDLITMKFESRDNGEMAKCCGEQPYETWKK